MRTSLRRREGMVPRALAPYQVAFPAGCQHCRTWRPDNVQVTQPPCAVLLCCVDGHGWLCGDNGVKRQEQNMVKDVRWRPPCLDAPQTLLESLRQNPARAGVDPVLLPSFGVVCFLSLYISFFDCLCLLVCVAWRLCPVCAASRAPEFIL